MQIMLEQTRPIKLEVARDTCCMICRSQYRLDMGGHVLLPGRRLPRDDGHLQDGKSGECIKHFGKDFAYRRKRFLCR